MFELLVFLQHAEVGGIAFSGDYPGIDSRFHGAAGFVGVGTGSEAALPGSLEHFGEVFPDFLLLEVDETEPSKSRRINHIASGSEGVHFI